MFITRRIVLVCTLAALALSSIAFAQSPKAEGQDQKKPPAKDPADPNLLAGPSVEDEATEGQSNMTGPGGAQRRRAEGLPLRQWLQQVRSLDGITAEQQQKVASIMQEMERAQQELRAEHGEEMRQLQEKIRQMREGGREPDPAVREQMQKLESETPKPTDYQRRIWETLTSDQQEALRRRISQLEQQMQQQRRRGAYGAGRGQPADTVMTNSAPKPGSGDEMMTGDGDEAMKPALQGTVDRPNAREVLQQQRRRRAAAAAGGDGNLAGLDEMARRRVEFLRQFVSASSPSRAGEAPSSDERDFKFDEEM